MSTRQIARLNIFLNPSKPTNDVAELAQYWKAMMPREDQDFFKIAEITEDTTYTEIHLHCPLRGTGNVEACYKLMNYDRSLMQVTNAELIVLASQSNSGKNYCRLAIRKKGQDTSDLIPAHEKVNTIDQYCN